MKLLVLLISIVSLLQMACRKSRDPIEQKEVIIDGEASTESGENADGNLSPEEESLLNDLDMTMEDLEKAKEEAKLDMEEAEAKEPPKFYTLTFKHSGRCLEVSGNAVNAEANIQQGDCNGGAHQKFQLVPSELPDHYFLKNLNSSLCVTLSGANRNDGTNIFQFDCINSDIQKFLLIDQGDGHSVIRNKFSEKCFDNTLSNIFTPNNIIQWQCHGDDNQRIKLTEVTIG